MTQEFFEKLTEMSKKGEPFTIATVIKAEGSTSAKPGSKAIFNNNGKRIFGWVGGGCAENEVGQESINCILENKTSILPIDLDDEVLGAGMPCGGTLEVFIEPQFMKPELVLVGHGKVVELLVEFGSLMNMNITVDDPLANTDNFPKANNLRNTKDYEQMEFNTNSYVIVATQHKGDHFVLKQALKSEAPYIALIASKKRTELTLQYVLDIGISRELLHRVQAPAGLDLGGITPEEIALSVISQIVAVQRGGSGRPLMEVKGVRIPTEKVKQ